MAKDKKYDCRLEQTGADWTAEITRRVTSKKRIVTKRQDGFTSEAEAKAWAEETLAKFAGTLSSSNQRHGEHRKANDEERRLRSSRRADKTQKTKDEKLAAQNNTKALADAENGLVSEIADDEDLASEYDFGPEDDQN